MKKPEERSLPQVTADGCGDRAEGGLVTSLCPLQQAGEHTGGRSQKDHMHTLGMLAESPGPGPRCCSPLL